MRHRFKYILAKSRHCIFGFSLLEEKTDGSYRYYVIVLISVTTTTTISVGR